SGLRILMAIMSCERRDQILGPVRGLPFLISYFLFHGSAGPDSINMDPWIAMDPVYGSALFETTSHGNLYTGARVTPEPFSTRTCAIPKSITHGSAGPDSINADPWISADPEHGSGLSPGYFMIVIQGNYRVSRTRVSGHEHNSLDRTFARVHTY